MSRSRIGCSGYDYDHWRGVLYPRNPTTVPRLEQYATAFETVEINNTFYRLPTESTCDTWRDSVPADFVFSVKLSRYGTHFKHLREPELWLPPFVERVERLAPKLGPVLVQLPPRWNADPARLDRFLDIAAGGHRWAVEVRDRRWLCDEVYEVLARHDAALCIHDLIPHHPQIATASWIYLRFHGPRTGAAGSYPRPQLARAATRIRDHLAAGRDVFAYFNNDAGGHAVRDARTLMECVADATQ